MKKEKYYARTEEEKLIDSDLRKLVEQGSQVDVALFVQNQMILTELRLLAEKVTGLIQRIDKIGA